MKTNVSGLNRTMNHVKDQYYSIVQLLGWCEVLTLKFPCNMKKETIYNWEAA